jgi:5-methylcytosine-specific restriction enzyme subunit McrC
VVRNAARAADEPSDHEHGQQERDDQADAGEHIGENNSGAVLDGHDDRQSRGWAASVHGRYNCKWREHSFDNPITRLIHTTFEVLSKRDAMANLVSDAHREKSAFAEACGRRIVRASFNRSRRKQNPYFAAYDEVADLSRKIIANESADVSLDDEDFSGFLFDISLLFENYIRKLLEADRIRLEPKEKDAVAYPTGGARGRMRALLPDIILHGQRSTLILDTKYKWWNKQEGISREDAFQIITYAACYREQYLKWPVRGYGFVFPRMASERTVPRLIKSIFRELGMHLYVFFLDVPEDGMFEAAESSLVNEVRTILDDLDRSAC